MALTTREQPLSEVDVERAAATAYAFFREQGGWTPHAIIDDLVGLDDYRRFMRCPDAEVLAAYAEDALSLDDALRVAAHESRCSICRADVAELRGFVRQQMPHLLAAVPVWASPFVGRAELRESLSATLATGNTPLLTLAAPSGTGKTRLTLETAVEQSFLFPDGVWYAPMAGASDATVAAAEIARAVQLRLSPKEPPVEQLREFFADKRALLVLDDVPAQSPAAQVVTELIVGASDLCCLATTTGSFGVRGEQTVNLPPLQTPYPSSLIPHPSSEDLLSSESLQLFAAHVQTIHPDFEFDEPDVRSAAAVCERAAGMPLGIELAAARVREMPPDEILRRLGERDVPIESPVESLDDMIAWSYALLSPREQNLLQQLSVFASGFFVEQAAAVCEVDNAPELIESLEQKAMLQRMESLGRARYQLLMPIREFARQRLGGRLTEARERHARFFLGYAQQRDGLLTAPQQVDAMQEMSADLPNFRAGMEWAERTGEWRAAGGYGLALRQFLLLHGFWHECSYRLRVSAASFQRAQLSRERERAQIALARCLTLKGEYDEAESILRPIAERATQQGDAALLAEVHHGLGNIAQYRGRYDEAIAHIEEAMQRYAATGNRWGVADCLQNLGYRAWMQGDYERAERYLTDSLTIQRERGDRYRLGHTLACLGNVVLAQGRLEEARQWFEECLQARQELGDVRGVASALNDMGTVWQALGDFARAEYCFAEAVRRFQSIGDRRDWGRAIANQGGLALARGDTARARMLFEESLKILEAVGDAHGVAWALGDLGQVTLLEGRWEDASQLYRQSITHLHALGDVASVGVTLYRYGELLLEQGDVERAALVLNAALALCTERRRQERAAVEAALRQAEERLGAEQATALRQQASGMTLEEVIALTVQQLE